MMNTYINTGFSPKKLPLFLSRIHTRFKLKRIFTCRKADSPENSSKTASIAHIACKTMESKMKIRHGTIFYVRNE